MRKFDFLLVLFTSILFFSSSYSTAYADSEVVNDPLVTFACKLVAFKKNEKCLDACHAEGKACQKAAKCDDTSNCFDLLRCFLMEKECTDECARKLDAALEECDKKDKAPSNPNQGNNRF